MAKIVEKKMKPLVQVEPEKILTTTFAAGGENKTLEGVDESEFNPSMKSSETAETVIPTVSLPSEEEVLVDDEDEDVTADANAISPLKDWSQIQAEMTPKPAPAVARTPSPAAVPSVRITQDLGVVLTAKRDSLSPDQLKEISRGLRLYGVAVQVILVDNFNQMKFVAP